MKIDGPLYATLDNTIDSIQAMADIGYDGIYTMEGAHDPFFPLILASEHAPQLDITTAIAVSFPRNPLHLAYQALDLQNFSKGKFTLGLGSQIKPHIEKRFGTDFTPVAKRMGEQIDAIKAVFACFQNGEPLNFEGDYYRHTLMTDMFNPGPCQYGLPPVLTGGFGPKMCEMAGRHADGLIIHPFNNPAYINNLVKPNIEKGLAQSSRNSESFIYSVAGMVITGQTEALYTNAYTGVRDLLAFYGSTRAYLPALEAIGYGDLQPLLKQYYKDGKFQKMNNLITDEIVAAFAIIAEPKDVAAKILEKYGSYATRFNIYAPYFADNALWYKIINDIRRLKKQS